MSSDGANQGVNAERAIETILGGKPAATKEEQQTREQVRARLSGAPTPGGPSPKGYGEAADALARAFLDVLAEHPEVPIGNGDELWKAVKARWPTFDDWAGGLTGFQFGWAVNCVRWLSDQSSIRNPALVEL